MRGGGGLLLVVYFSVVSKRTIDSRLFVEIRSRPAFLHVCRTEPLVTVEETRRRETVMPRRRRHPPAARPRGVGEEGRQRQRRAGVVGVRVLLVHKEVVRAEVRGAELFNRRKWEFLYIHK